MARIDNTTRITVRNAQAYIEDQVHLTNNKLREAEDLIKKLTNEGTFTQADITTFKNKLLQDAKDAKKNQYKMERWLISFLNLGALPTAYTDVEVDAIDEDIRTHEE